MELWDVYDKDRNLTGRLHRRGEPMPPGDYFMAVHIWIRNSAGRYLIQKRSANKPYLPGMWECAASGAAQAGDSSLAAALRETREEIGLELPPDSLRRIAAHRSDDCFHDYWYTELDVDAGSLILQEEEVAEVRWASGEEIREMIADGSFFWNDACEGIAELP